MFDCSILNYNGKSSPYLFWPFPAGVDILLMEERDKETLSGRGVMNVHNMLRLVSLDCFP